LMMGVVVVLVHLVRRFIVELRKSTLNRPGDDD
jgi:hypothetical protein